MIAFSVASAYLFLIMTSVSLYFTITGNSIQSLATVFDTLYVLIYAFFLFTYYHLRRRPSIYYVLGVVLYFVGYVAFLLMAFWGIYDKTLVYAYSVGR